MIALKKFGEVRDAHQYSRVIQAWMILVGRASCGECITYSELSLVMLGKVNPRSRALRLGQLLEYCKERDLPCLPVIVVTKKSGLPAQDAPYQPKEIDPEMRKVFDYPWYQLYPPTEGEVESLY